MTTELKTVPTTTDRRFLSIKEAAHRIGVSRKTVEQMIYRHDNPLPSLKLGRRRLIDVDALDAFVLRHAA